jgi:hypothetical protein
MRYIAPSGTPDPFDESVPYIGRNLAAGIQGSRVPPGAVEHSQREIVNVIKAAGLAPDEDDLTQLEQAIRRLFRTRLLADTTFYVAPTGNDNNPGTSGSPWKTLAKAASYIQTQLDLNGFTVTVSVANGTYTDPFVLSGFVPGQLDLTKVVVQGNTSTPTSCFVNCSTVAPFGAANGAAFTVRGFQVSGTSVTAQNGSGIYAASGATIAYSNMAFNSCAFAHVFAENGGYCVAGTGLVINSNAPSHIFAKNGGIVSITGRAHTITGGPTFSGAFAQAEWGVIEAATATFSGSASGPRYYSNMNGVIKTAGGGANFFPGSTTGSVNAGGQYV